MRGGGAGERVGRRGGGVGSEEVSERMDTVEGVLCGLCRGSSPRMCGSLEVRG